LKPLALLDEELPGVILRESSRVADHEKEMLGPCDSHIHPSLIDQESETSLQASGTVCADTVDDNDVLLLALKCIDSVDFDVPYT
jgi:hypothetical protein